MEIEALFDLELPHGRAVALAIPEANDPPDLLATLRPEELALAASWGAPRRKTWIAGRAALRIALLRAGFDAPAIGSDDRGAPVLPEGVVGSVSHKERVAVALVGRAEASFRIGVDVELDAPLRTDITRAVLTEGEVTELAALEGAGRLAEVKLRFSAKEAIYKALDPFVRRYVGFREVSVTPRPDGSARVQMHLPPAEGPFEVEVRWLRRHGLLLTTARVRR
jgi:4'-phosphopantetheinyl transferase EntD